MFRSVEIEFSELKYVMSFVLNSGARGSIVG
jgi:hypothetical protein